MSNFNVNVVVADKGREKVVRLLDQTTRGTKLTSVVVRGKTGEVRRFCRHEDGLFEDAPTATGLRKFLVSSIFGGTVEQPAPSQNPLNEPRREQPKGDRATYRPKKGKKSHPTRKAVDPLKVLTRQELPDNAGMPDDGKVISFN